VSRRVFDNADEALLNDYEQILQLLGAGGESAVAKAFKGLIDDFIHRNPFVTGEVQDEWDALGVPDASCTKSRFRLTGSNGQILMALQKERCKYITVEGATRNGQEPYDHRNNLYTV